MRIEKYSFGMGDRFGQQGRAQLQAVIEAGKRGIEITPVWNKSSREHSIVRSAPVSVRREADEAVAALGWERPYRVDADHIRLATMDGFVESSDFFTIDVAEHIGAAIPAAEVAEFIFESKIPATISVPGIAELLVLNKETVEKAVKKFLGAIRQAGCIYRRIAKLKGQEFITEISIDETDEPQTPIELFCILAMLANERVPCQTIAPKFRGRFNKGVDYVGDLIAFEREFEEDLCLLRFAIDRIGFPDSLKLSVHSGSDKFSIYPVINRLLKKHGTGLHLKTAGTTWLEEIIGLAENGGTGLEIVHEIYAEAYQRFNELTKPYATVLDIDPLRLPKPAEVNRWNSREFAAALRHDAKSPSYNLHFRQFIHVAFKVAAKMGHRYIDELVKGEAIVSRNVTHNLLERHILPIFGRASS